MLLHYIKIKYIIFFALLSSNIIAQDEINNLKKYWYYRERLKYFVYPGSDRGESIVANIRNGWVLDSEDKWDYLHVDGNPLITMGYYIGMLATEYKLLSDNSQNTVNTYNELKLALEALDRLDNCETLPPYNKAESKKDGFLKREDMPINFLSNQNRINSMNKNIDPFLIWDHSYSDGNVKYARNVSVSEPYAYSSNYISMSQDEIIGLFIGLALSSKLLEGTYCGELSDDLIYRIVDYIRGPSRQWMIIDPRGFIIENDYGGDLRWASYGLAIAASKLTNRPLSDFYNLLSTSSPEGQFGYAAWQAIRYAFAGPKTGTNRMIMTVATIGDSWESFYLGGMISNTDQFIYNYCFREGWECFYLLLWKTLHDRDNFMMLNVSSNVIQDKAYVDLCGAPSKGPFYFDNNGAPNGWASFLKYNVDRLSQFAIVHQEQGSSVTIWKGHFTGLDYMLLYNLYRLTYKDYDGRIMPSYINMMDKDLYGYLPLNANIFGNDIYFGIGNNTPLSKIDAFNTIVSDMTIGNKTQNNIQIPGDVTYRAGDEITLTDGFTVEAGASFTAYISPFSSGNELTYRSTNTINDTLLYGFHYDSLEIDYIRPYYTPLAENYNSPEEMLKDFKSEKVKTDTVQFNNYDIFSLAAYPNPFNNTTTLEYNVPSDCNVKISIYNIYGNKIIESIDAYHTKGQYTIDLNLANYSNAVYYCKLKSENESKTIKIIKN